MPHVGKSDLLGRRNGPAMPRTLSQSATALRPSVFATLADRMKQLPPDHLPLHIGDTFRKPPTEAQLQSFRWSEWDSLYKYSHPFGLETLLATLTDKLKKKNGIPCSANCVQTSCGATGGLASAAATLLEPGDEVLVLAPYWPLIKGILLSRGCLPVEVPFTTEWSRDPDFDPLVALSTHLTPRTKALYFSNPNNPDGFVYSEAQLRVLADFAIEHDLWVLSDEAYEDYLYDQVEHISIAALPGMFERTLSVYTFSKSYAMAGLRLGYVVAPEAVSGALRRVSNHQIYNLSGALQRCAEQAVKQGEGFLAESRALYQPARDALFSACAGRCRKPSGGGYVFLELADGPAAWDLIHRALDRGLCSAPGEAFGQDFAHCVRICFTAAPLPDIERGAAILKELLN